MALNRGGGADPSASPTTDAIVVLSRKPSVHGEVMRFGAARKQRSIAAHSGADAFSHLERSLPRAVVIDRDSPEAEDLLQRLVASPLRDRTMVIVVTREVTTHAPVGAHMMVSEATLPQALELADPNALRPPREPIAFDRLLAVSLLSGPLDVALEAVAGELAAGFGVERCVVSVRGDSTGGAAGGAHTWDSLAWNKTAERCRAASASEATLIAPGSSSGAHESYLAVPLSPPVGSHGFLGLVAEQALVFSREHRATLRAVASRFATELGWRAVHQRTTDELDRVGSAPGHDMLLGIWNRLALADLATMQISASRRSGLPVAIAMIDVVDLQGINNRHGLQTGDRLLRRIADAVRTTLRTEDVIGRWSGDKVAVILHGTPIEGAHRVAERLRTAFDERPLELPSGELLALPVTVGIAALGPTETANALIARAVGAAKEARDGGIAISRASTAPAPRLSQLDVGEELRATLGGSYRLLHEISRGGMGVVYRAEDLALERPVAIKMLRPDLAEDRAFVEHLRTEAAMLARLQHPNLVQIYSFGQTGSDSYFVMELVEGEGLQQAVERHRLEATQMPLHELIAAIEEVASALDALHDRGIVHRDVKPANVLRDPFRNRAVLVDVGIARRFGQFAESAGTPGYVAPEVIAGQDATPRSDVYGLAATAYTLLTLAMPWGEGTDVIARQCSGEPITPPSTYRPELAAADELLISALSTDPILRPASAGDLARSLRTALALTSAPPKTDGPRWNRHTVVPSRAAIAKTRGVVFRSVARAIGVRDSERLRDGIGGTHPEIARALTETAPLAWVPTDMFTRLLAIAPFHVGRDSSRLARDIGRATVRASFRRFFPASAATLVTERTLSAIRNVWSQYQTWGNVSSMPVNATETVVRIAESLGDPELCVWTMGMLDQLVTLSGGRAPTVDHEACISLGDRACLFRVTWDREPAA
ncbi:MAG: Serine/threonine protein kinase [Myxococcales bacterium]|nr:Serine/threonine protein kinase [Myxococcales bacterium]